MNRLLAENYEVIQEVGRGGMGVVYLAQDRRLNRKVAVKELLISGQSLLPDEVENVVARFQREALAAAKLQHPGIVSVYDYVRDGDAHFMVMEFLEGKSLQHYIDDRKAFTIEQTIDIASQLCAALDYAHAHQIVHRDIKPDNVLLLDNGKIKLMDFGVARHVGEVSKLTQAGTTLGTIAYMSPEQLCDSRLVDGRSDIFSLGAMIYEMLTLRTPFDAGNVGGTIMKIMSEEPVSPRQMNPGIPPRLEAVILRSLRKSPDERFQKAGEMAQALQNSLRQDGGASAQARPVQLNMVTCRSCGTGIPSGRGPCPKCGRLQAPPAPATVPGTAPHSSPPRPVPSSAPAGAGRPLGAPGAPHSARGTGALPPLPAGGAVGRPFAGPQPGGVRPPTGGIRPAGANTGALRARPVIGARFLFSFGTSGFNAGEFQQPRGVTIDARGLVYVADTENSRIQVFDAQGNHQRDIRPALGRESFRFPRSLTIAPQTGRIYVVDELDYRIYVLDAEGQQLSVWDRRRNPKEPTAVPGRLAISGNGTIYVSEPNGHRVIMYSPTQAFLANFGVNGELQTPSGIYVGPKYVLYVLDYGQCKVHTFDSRGKAGLNFGRRGNGPGEFSVPRDLTVDRSGHVFVADTLNHRVQVFDPQGGLLISFGQKGKQAGEFSGPEGIALSPDDLLYVSDRGNNRVQVFQIDRA
ncbi:MAG: protein kinase [Candidatus Sericytochromatia bacterium]|nr:protein kinase [Candidatus Sericytochromatia bacterium]